jgi:homoserine dehydrogenase
MPAKKQEKTADVHVGILGKGTVGGAFKELLTDRAEMVAEVSGRRPKVTGVLSSKKGNFDEILAASDIVVELIGGIDPARDYVTRALREGRHVVTANKQLIAQHGGELVAAAREGGAQLRFEAAVAGAIPVIRVVQESLGAIPIEKVFVIVNGTTN